jgi:hypothetical protein
MNESPAPAPVPAKPRLRFRRWLRRLAKVALVLVVLLVVGGIVFRTTQRALGARELARVQAKLDADEPGWRLEDLAAAHAKTVPPEAENAFAVALRVHALLPREWHLFNRHGGPEPDDVRPYNRRSRPDDLLSGSHQGIQMRMVPGSVFTKDDFAVKDSEKLNHLFRETHDARELARTLADVPRGGRTVEYGVNPLDADMNPVQNMRSAFALASQDAMEAAHAGDARRALRAARAGLSAARAIGGEPSLISQLVRTAGGKTAADAAVRVLGLLDPKDAAGELAALQTALLVEADVPLLVISMRAERAMWHRILVNLENGMLQEDPLTRIGFRSAQRPAERVAKWVADSYLRHDTAKFLELSSRGVAASTLPFDQRLAALAAIEGELRGFDTLLARLKYTRTRILFPATEKMAQVFLLHRAALLTAAAGIACERFRLKSGRWPKSLDEVPKDVLAAVPLDPFTGKPLTLTKTDDGIAVTATNAPDKGRDRAKGYGGEKPETGPLGGSEIGWRLFDPSARGLPAPPPKPKDDPLDPDQP